MKKETALNSKLSAYRLKKQRADGKANLSIN